MFIVFDSIRSIFSLIIFSVCRIESISCVLRLEIIGVPVTDVIRFPSPVDSGGETAVCVVCGASGAGGAH